MTDSVNSNKRSQIMAAIKSKDTTPELLIRKALHANGIRFRLHSRQLPGKPDIVLPKYKAVIFVHGCFWHGHECEVGHLPSSNRVFWIKKICGNKERDLKNRELLHIEGWRVLIIWECSIRGKNQLGLEKVTQLALRWLQEGGSPEEIRGKTTISQT